MSDSGVPTSPLAAEDPDQVRMMEELCILVDDCDVVQGSCSKKDCHRRDERGESKCHRAFSVFLFNEKNELLIQQRSAAKITFPLIWANTCCSHPLASIPGEAEESGSLGVKRAAIRKLHHELGIPLTTFTEADFDEVAVFHYSAPYNEIWAENEIDHVLRLRVGCDPSAPALVLAPNPQEVAETRFLSLDEVDKWTSEESGAFSPWFLKIVRSGILAEMITRGDGHVDPSPASPASKPERVGSL